MVSSFIKWPSRVCQGAGKPLGPQLRRDHPIWSFQASSSNQHCRVLWGPAQLSPEPFPFFLVHTRASHWECRELPWGCAFCLVKVQSLIKVRTAVGRQWQSLSEQRLPSAFIFTLPAERELSACLDLLPHLPQNSKTRYFPPPF